MTHSTARHLLLLALAPLGQASGQAVTDSSPFRPLELPAPTTVRSAAGRPGGGYWQQRVDYRIRASLDTATHELRGREVVRYVNRSPDALPYLWLHLEQNICAPGSITNVLDQPPLVFLGTAFDFSCKGFAGGVTLDAVTSTGRPLLYRVFGTTMRIDLATPIPAGGVFDFDIAWHFTVPPYGAGRMGRDGPLYEIAQWYPRVAVYDDVRGWNHEPYIGAGEFYLEYGSFDVSVTLPAGFVVAATGTLQNPLTVLTRTQRGRLALARASDTAIAVITRDEAMAEAATGRGGLKTWHFRADSVRDFAFAATPGFRWDASSYKGILVHTFYRPGAELWTEANRMVREGLKYYSEQWYPYPYAHISSIEGPVEGMEYPMMTFDPAGPTRIDLQWVVAHELGHQWMPMIVGSNERLYPWMDEGFNTFIDLKNTARYFEGTPYGDSIETNSLRLYAEHAVPGLEQPLIARPTEVRDLFWTGYQKPALMMQQLRYQVLGVERFDAAFREYLRAWAFRHPTPADFFRIMRDQSGMDLDWFWRGWVLTTSRLDQSVDSVVVRGDSLTEVHLASRGTMIMPAALMLTLEDGSVRNVPLPAEMWNLGPCFVFRLPGGPKVRTAVLDASGAMPDSNRGNNYWPR